MEDFNFEIVKPPTEEELETKREKTRLRVAAHRERKRTLNNPAARLANTWTTNFESLPELERVALLAQADRCKQLLDRIFADDFTAYREVKTFIEKTGGTVRHFVPVQFADEVDLEKESASDQNFIKFGFRTRIWEMFYREYLRHLLVQGGLPGYGFKMNDSPNVGDAETLAEIQAEYDQMVAHLKEPRPELPASVVGVRQRTKNEEAAHLAYVEDRKIQQTAFDKSYRQHLLDKLNAELDGENT